VANVERDFPTFAEELVFNGINQRKPNRNNNSALGKGSNVRCSRLTTGNRGAWHGQENGKHARESDHGS
jgi:hypothetical protein